MENGISYFYAAVLVLLQFPCMLLARTKPLACDIKTISSENDFFNFTKNTMTSKVFLATICVSIGVLACADGFLRGYPDDCQSHFERQRDSPILYLSSHFASQSSFSRADSTIAL